MYKSWKRMECPTVGMELDILGDTLKERFTAISQNNEWTGVSHKVGAYKVEVVQKAETPRATGRLPFQQWFDSQTCRKPHCGGNHPTKYHDNLEVRNSPVPPPASFRPGSRNRPSNIVNNTNKPTGNRKPGHNNRQNQRTPRFKSAQSEKSFRKNVYNAVCEAFVDDDHDLFAHLAGEVEEGDDEGFESAVEEGDVDTGDNEEMMANAAISLDQLLNW
jgi:hypothetical protein